MWGLTLVEALAERLSFLGEIFRIRCAGLCGSEKTRNGRTRHVPGEHPQRKACPLGSMVTSSAGLLSPSYIDRASEMSSFAIVDVGAESKVHLGSLADINMHTTALSSAKIGPWRSAPFSKFSCAVVRIVHQCAG